MDLIGSIDGVARRELGHDLVALELQQDVVFRIEMVGRDSVRAGYEDEALRCQHGAGRGLDHGAKFFQKPHQQSVIFGDLLDILEHCPAVAGGDMANGFADGEAIRTWLSIHAYRQISAVVLDGTLRQGFRQPGQRIEREAVVILQVMAQDVRSFGVITCESSV